MVFPTKITFPSHSMHTLNLCSPHSRIDTCLQFGVFFLLWMYECMKAWSLCNARVPFYRYASVLKKGFSFYLFYLFFSILSCIFFFYWSRSKIKKYEVNIYYCISNYLAFQLSVCCSFRVRCQLPKINDQQNVTQFCSILRPLWKLKRRSDPKQSTNNTYSHVYDALEHGKKFTLLF